MTLKQLRYILEVAKNGFNVSLAAETLHTVQPGISTQIKSLEDELGVQIFERYGKRLLGITPAGEQILHFARRIIEHTEDLKNVSADFAHADKGTLTIATTHTQVRYALPTVIQQFVQQFPQIQLRILQGNPAQICEKVINGEADIVIATEGIATYKELVMLPVYQWNRSIIAPTGHPLLDCKKLTLSAIAQYPIITYDFAFTGRSIINDTFAKHDLSPNVVLTAIDSDVIKHYVELGLGIGILASMAYLAEKDQGLKCRDASHLFPDSTTNIGIRHGRFIRRYMYAFIELFAPHLTPDAITQKMAEK